MARPGSERDDIEAASDRIKDDWSRTLHDMRAMAEDRESEGFRTVTIPAGDTATKSPKAGDTDEWGFVHVIPDNKADEFEALYGPGAFDETGVYQLNSGGHVFMVTEHIDLASQEVIFIAGSYRKRFAPGLVKAATSREKLYTHVKTLDGTKLGTFEHDDVDAFFPDPDSILAYEYKP